MIKNPIINVPVLFFLILFISKEIFSYDSEKIVILCILSFLIVAYFQLRTSIYEAFISKSAKLEEEFNTLADLKYSLEKNIRSFWRIFLDLEDQLTEIFFWFKNNTQVFVKKFNKNRISFNFHIVKDQLNNLLKDNLSTKNLYNSFLVKNAVFNFNSTLNGDFKLVSNNLSINGFFENLDVSNNETNFKILLLNKLNINRTDLNDKTSFSIVKNIFF